MSERSPAAPVVIVNRAASRLHDHRRRERTVASVLEAVEERTGRVPAVVDTTPDAARAALAAARAAPLVVVVGGDGTVREAAAALAGSGVPIGIVPAGTGNVFAAALGIPRRTSSAVRLIATGQPTDVDLGRAAWGSAGVGGAPGEEEGSQVFGVACGLGFDARVMAGATADLKRQLGFGAYIMATLREAVRLRPAELRVEVDGAVHELRGLVVLIANCGHLIPGVIGPRRAIDPTDGLLDVIVITAAGVPGGLAGAVEVLTAGRASPPRRARSLRLRATTVRVMADPPEPVEVDGDPHEADWLAASVLPGAMTILRP